MWRAGGDDITVWFPIFSVLQFVLLVGKYALHFGVLCIAQHPVETTLLAPPVAPLALGARARRGGRGWGEGGGTFLP